MQMLIKSDRPNVIYASGTCMRLCFVQVGVCNIFKPVETTCTI